MAGMRQLRQRLRSVHSIEKMTEAMYTASAAKYSQILRLRLRSQTFSRGCADILAEVGGDLVRRCESVQPRDAVVLLGGNRGMSGGFNAELFRFYDALPAPEDAPPLRIAGSAMAAAHWREQGLCFEEHPLSDVPTAEEIRALSLRVEQIYRSGEARRVFFVYQKWVNMLLQTPTRFQLLPAYKTDGMRVEDIPPLYLPDRETIGERLAVLRLEAAVRELVLDNAAGAQAATMMAMRTASDSARESAARLESSINRRRQAEVTASVIETTSGSETQGDV